jgi:hypothetical protein
MNSRRNFLKLVGVGAAVAPALPSIAEASPAPPMRDMEFVVFSPLDVRNSDFGTLEIVQNRFAK